MLHVGTNIGFNVAPSGGLQTFSSTARTLVVAPTLAKRQQSSPQYVDPQEYHIMTLPTAVQSSPTVTSQVKISFSDIELPVVEEAEVGSVARVLGTVEECHEPFQPYADKDSDVDPNPMPITRLRQRDVNMRPERVNGNAVVIAPPSNVTGVRLLSNPCVMTTSFQSGATLRPFSNRDFLNATVASAFPKGIRRLTRAAPDYNVQQILPEEECAIDVVVPTPVSKSAVQTAVTINMCGMAIPSKSRIDRSVNSTYRILTAPGSLQTTSRFL